MAFDYSTANSGKFAQSGKIIKYVNNYSTQVVTTLPAELKAIADQYEAADQTLQIAGLYGTYQGFQQTIVGIRQSLAAFVDATFLDFDSSISQLIGPPAADMSSVLSALHQQMLNDSKTVNRSTVTLGSVTAASGNSGNGVVLLTKVLDGYNAPLGDGQANIRYNGLNSELAVPSETMTFVCVADSMRDGTNEGAEQFSWNGGTKQAPFHWESEGSGSGPGLGVADGTYSIVVDGNFENWSTNTPSSWTLVGSTVAGTHLFAETSNIYRGTYSMKLLGTGALATMGVQQSISPSALKSRRRYLVALRIKAASVPAAGQIEVFFSGTGYSRTTPTDEVQTLQISGTPSGGTYTISWVGPYGGTQTTAAIAYNATSATVQAALRLLSGLESVVVTTAAGSPPNVTHSITFYGVPGNVNAITADITLLTGGTPAKAIATTTQGVEGDCIILPATAFPTTWGLRYFWINMPTVIPSDWKLLVEITGTFSNAVACYFDSLSLAEVVYHGGLGGAAVAGSTRFIVGDTFTAANTNDGAGVIQEFFRKWYRFQLPSSGSPNISDSLAT